MATEIGDYKRALLVALMDRALQHLERVKINLQGTEYDEDARELVGIIARLRLIRNRLERGEVRG